MKHLDIMNFHIQWQKSKNTQNASICFLDHQDLNNIKKDADIYLNITKSIKKQNEIQ